MGDFEAFLSWLPGVGASPKVDRLLTELTVAVVDGIIFSRFDWVRFNLIGVARYRGASRNGTVPELAATDRSGPRYDSLERKRKCSFGGKTGSVTDRS
jgi:hypothetical protein